MEIRKIKPEENVLASLVSTLVFLGQASEDYKEHLQNPLEHSDGYENIWGGFNDAGRLDSIMYVHDFDMRFDGHTVGMGGIGGVSTLPEARTGGYIRRVFDRVLPDMREQGKVFSFLYPFSFAFYRKFGYELCYCPNRVSVPVEFFRQYPFPDGITMYRPGDDVAPYAAVYEAFIRDRNLPLVRDMETMKEKVDKDPYITRRYAYLHRDAGGRPDAYLLFSADSGNDDGNDLKVREFAWTSPEALHAMCGFIGGLSPQFNHFRWDAPQGINVHALFAEGYEISAARPASGMNRIVHVPRALELLKAPALNGRAVIQAADKTLPVNDGVYAVEWENGAVTTVRRTDQAPDLETGVETLAQLVTGYLNLDEARLKRGVAVHGNDAALRALFPHKDLYIADHF